MRSAIKTGTAALAAVLALLVSLSGCGPKETGLTPLQATVAQMTFTADGQPVVGPVDSGASSIALYGYRLGLMAADAAPPAGVDEIVKARVRATFTEVGKSDRASAADLEELWLAHRLIAHDESLNPGGKPHLDVPRLQPLRQSKDSSVVFWASQILFLVADDYKPNAVPCTTTNWRTVAESVARGAVCDQARLDTVRTAVASPDLGPADLLRVNAVADRLGLTEAFRERITGTYQRAAAEGARTGFALDGYTVGVLAAVSLDLKLTWSDPALRDFLTFACRALGASPQTAKPAGLDALVAEPLLDRVGLPRSKVRLLPAEPASSSDEVAGLLLPAEPPAALLAGMARGAASKERLFALAVLSDRRDDCEFLHRLPLSAVRKSVREWAAGAKSASLQALPVVLAEARRCGLLDAGTDQAVTAEVKQVWQSAAKGISSQRYDASEAPLVGWSVLESACVLSLPVADGLGQALDNLSKTYLDYTASGVLTDGVAVQNLYGALRIQQLRADGCGSPWWT